MHSTDDDAGGVTYLSDSSPGHPALPPGERPSLSLEQTLRPATPPVSPHGTLIQGAVTPLPAPVAARGLVPGQVVADRYQVRKWLGSGGTAAVYEVLDLQTNQHVALKVLAVPHAEETLVTRFRREVEHARALEHVNILRVFDVGWDGERHFLTVELLAGMDLRQLLQERRPTLAGALRWLTHATVALEHAHARGVLHRDIKPGNLFITRTGVLKLMDFGLAKSEHVPGTTSQGATLGTPEYMAPEQVMGTPPVSPASDLYSLGVVAYELFTGQLPFRHSQPVPLMFLHVQETPRPPRLLCPALPEPFERVVLKLMEKRPEDRYRNATELRAALAKLWPLVLERPS
ncbi:serine/threonine protein kinase [Cystobacter fuscus DSM 2262]|uniref:Serine/threonine protein kinase n=1 Tax=Cystobacter fuscus (strain ATCC 25194 / DSM 2262 / NBRC 100088 / M29) TaxID=1242864 RepID=S9PAX9_CYSF2|nr:serine/threonine-protein kinase [Cystobacter fuscus]EPX60266.1 serine/threonine protein kinase [Cystobacter fuscus DSM 2262]